MLLFKYIGPAAVSSVLREERVFSIRFNRPRQYNDPYELFLTPDEPLVTDEERAYYEFFLRALPEAPVTCFSRRPESVVMWAHYCREAAGICLAIDEEALLQQIDTAYIHDVEYSADPARISAEVVKFAYATGKNRHTVRVLEIASRAAYFRKRHDWSYEEERRLVVPITAVQDVHGLLLAQYPSKCLRAVILGPRISKIDLGLVEDWAGESGVPLLKMHYSRRRYEPFFTSDDTTFSWNQDQFDPADHVCEVCREPAGGDIAVCDWCGVSDADKQFVGGGNQMTLFLRSGVRKGLELRFDGLRPQGRRHGGEDDV